MCRKLVADLRGQAHLMQPRRQKTGAYLFTAFQTQYAVAIVCPFPAINYRFRSIISLGFKSLPFAQ